MYITNLKIKLLKKLIRWKLILFYDLFNV
jgi:hypothetical protein